MNSLACNEKIIAMLKQHPEGGEKFFDALDLMIRSDKNIIESFCLLIKEFLSSGRSTSTCAVLSGHFGRYMLNTCSNFLKNNFNEILLVNGGIRTGNKVELDYLPKSKNLVFIDDSQVILKMKGKNKDTTIGASKIEETPQNVKDFTDICNKMVLTYKAKNHDYGNSFHNTFKKYGIVSALTRMSDKFNRLDTLYNKNDNKVNESIEDTLLDLANYAVMTLVELENSK